MKSELQKFLEHIANNVGEVMTEYHWREACELLKELDQESEFKKGDKVLVRDCEYADWIERVYVIEHNGRHYVKTSSEDILYSYKFIKPYEEQRKWYKSISLKNRITYDLMDTTEKLGLIESGFVVLEITDKEFINQLENN